LASLAGAGALQAADLPLKAPSAEPIFSLTDPYLGLYGGGAWSAAGYATPDAICQFGGFFCPGGASGHNQPFYQGAGSVPAQYDLSRSLVGGGTAGFNWQTGKTVFRLEGEAGTIRMSGVGEFLTNGRHPCNPATPLNPPCSNYDAFSSLGNWYGTLASRVGIAGDALAPAWSEGNRALLYFKAGAALGRFETGVTSSNFPGATFALINYSAAQTVAGVALGGGLEWAFSGAWSLKFEYDYLGFDRTVQACGLLTGHPRIVEVPSSTFCTTTPMHGINTATVGVNYRF